MKLAVLHDKNGNIASLVAFPDGSPAPALPAGAGQLVTELDAPELAAGLRPAEVASRLKNLADNFRIEVVSNERRLVGRS